MKNFMTRKTALSLGILSLMVLAGFDSQSAEAFNLNVFGGLNRYNYKDTPSTTGNLSNKWKISYGATLAFSVAPLVQLEGGIFQHYNGYDRGTSTVSFSSYELPVMVRVVPFHFLNLGVGMYYENFGSDYETKTNTTTTKTQWSNANYKNSTIGLKWSARLVYAAAPLVGVFFDLSLKTGLSDRNKSTTGEYRDRAVLALAGVQIGF